MVTSDRRSRLAAAVAGLAHALATGAVEPDGAELRALAAICDDHQLPIEAARLRLWSRGTRPWPWLPE